MYRILLNQKVKLVLFCVLALVVGPVIFCLIDANAAEVIDLRHYQSPSGRFTPQQTSDPAQLHTFLNLEAESRLTEIRRLPSPRNGSATRYQQEFRGTPIWGKQVIIHYDKQGHIRKTVGQLVRGLEQDLPGRQPFSTTLSAEDALALARDLHVQEMGQDEWTYSNEFRRKFVYVDADSTARLVYYVHFFVDAASGRPSRPYFLIDANTGEVLKQWDGLAYDQAQGTGPGGNQKVGKYEYGVDFEHLEVNQNGSRCGMVNDFVRTIDLRHKTYGSTIYYYDCPRNTYKEINGAYSPLNDAHFMGGVVHDMYQAWYKMPPLNSQIRLRVHYSRSYQNAFWDGTSVSFGDGADDVHPLVSLDVVSHEISHGFTEQHSNLIYEGQSGGINESFSDVAGEAAEFFLAGSNDWLAGAAIVKNEVAARYLNDPPRDGNSIDHASNFHADMDVHHSSGVFNKAFYLLATTSGWDTRKALDVYILANRSYWVPTSDFIDAGAGLIDAALELGYRAVDVWSALDMVGVALSEPAQLMLEIPVSATETQTGVTGIVNITPIPQEDTALQLLSDDTGEVVVPESVTVPAGTSKFTFPITLPDDALYDGPQTVSIEVTATGFTGDIEFMTVHDDDDPILSLTVPATVNESDGILAGQGIISVGSAVSGDVTIGIHSTDPGEISVPDTVILRDGQLQTSFDLTIIDDKAIDGSQRAVIKVTVPGWNPESAEIEVSDNEHRELILTIPLTAAEGDGVWADAGNVSISGTLQSDLSVVLSSDDLSEVVVPSTVIIPRGQTNITFNVTIIDDEGQDGTQTATISAVATDFAADAGNIDVYDDENLVIMPAIQAGGAHTLVLKGDGSALAWGRNYHGQLGTGTDSSNPIPVQIATPVNFISISAALSHSVGLRADNTVWTWGNNYYGQIGDGTSELRYTPAIVSLLKNVTSIDSRRNHSLALRSDGTIWAWGQNEFGQLGDGSRQNRSSPVQSYSVEQVSMIAAGNGHSIVLKADGTAWGWGHNASGQLGHGDFASPQIGQVKAQIEGITAIAAGSEHTIALKDDGTVWSWGANRKGQLGDGSTENRHTPAIVSGLYGITAIAAGSTHNIALQEDGTVWSWGLNSWGQLGDGTTTNRLVPVCIIPLKGIIAVAAGDKHNAAVTADGAIWSWGDNSNGKLGDGTTYMRKTPVQVVDQTGNGTLDIIPMSLLIPNSSKEGAGVLRENGLVKIDSPLSNDLKVKLTSSVPSEVLVPEFVTIPAGHNSVTFNLTIVDDTLLDGSQYAVISASSPKYTHTSASILVHDNESNVLTLVLPESVTEGDGLYSNGGRISSSQAVSRDVAVTLVSTISDQIHVPRTVIIPAGQSDATFDLSIVDDELIDGNQNITISATVIGWSSGEDTITVIDNEHRRLSLLVPEHTGEWETALSNAGTISISGTLPNDLSVTLTSSDTTEATVPISVTIPAGQTSVAFDISIIDDKLIDPPQLVVITASSAGFTSSAATVRVQNDFSLGGEFKINSNTHWNQVLPSLAELNGGNFVVVWLSEVIGANEHNIIARLFDHSGKATTPEIKVNKLAATRQAFPDVAALSDGGFVIVWHSINLNSQIPQITGQRYTSSGVGVGQEFEVITGVDHYNVRPTVAGLLHGGFIVTWQNLEVYPHNTDLFGQSFNKEGQKTGAKFKINTYTTQNQTLPDITGLENGGFAIAWQSYGQDGSGDGIFYQQYDQNGSKVGSEDQTNTTTIASQTNPRVASLANGGSVVAWTSNHQNSRHRVFAQIYGKTGLKEGSEFLVSGAPNTTESKPSVTSLDHDNFAIAWSSSGNRSLSFDIYGQVFLPDGTKLGNEFRINTYLANRQEHPKLTKLSGGKFVVVWQSWFQDGSYNGIFGQLFTTDLDNDLLPDHIENKACTKSNTADSDNDGILDGIEDLNQNGVINNGESNPCDGDSDSDGLNDGVEDANQNGVRDAGETDPTKADSDSDGLDDGTEDKNKNGSVDDGETDPLSEDSDGDGLNDGWEVNHGLNPLDDTGDNGADGDPDEDGFTNAEEHCSGSDPKDATSKPVPPTADAGPHQTVSEGVTVTLDGTNSSDLDGQVGTYAWKQIAGQTVQLSDLNVAQPTFTSPVVESDGTSLTFELTVTDNCGYISQVDNCTVNVTWINDPPTANAGPDKTAAERSTVTLDGSGSTDPENSIASYNWLQVNGSTVLLSDATAAASTFTAPDIGIAGETLEFKLTVTDSGGLHHSDTCLVNVTWINEPPTAQAGSDQTVDEGDTVTLSGSASVDPDDGIIGYVWTQVSGKPVTLLNPLVSDPTFVTPCVDVNNAVLVFQLTVQDKGGLQSNDSVIVTVMDNGITDFPDDVLPIRTAKGKRIGLKERSGGNCVLVKPIDPTTITNNHNRPQNLLYDLFDLRVKTDTPGGTVRLVFHLPQPAPAGYTWIKYSAARGWIDFGANAVFNATRDQVTLTLTDGGPGDDDGVANGMIVDPSGPGTAATSSDSGGSSGGGGGGGGCFIAAAASGARPWLFIGAMIGFLLGLALISQRARRRCSQIHNHRRPGSTVHYPPRRHSVIYLRSIAAILIIGGLHWRYEHIQIWLLPG